MIKPNPCPYHDNPNGSHLYLVPVLIGHWKIECACGASGPMHATEAEATEDWNKVAKPIKPATAEESVH